MKPETEGVELGHYRLGRLLGSGGMGEVYLARDVVLNRDVAIKFLTPTTDENSTFTHRLLQEAQAAAALDHPFICSVYDVGVDPAGRAYMVMQYVQGSTLAARLSQGPLPVRDAMRLCTQIAEALAAAHQAGIIHRDLKPQNIIVTPSGQPKLLDFGIARFLPAESSSDAETGSGRHLPAGTPAYMSPEQVQQRPVDARSDLFALGAILFECLTGQRAFVASSTLEVLSRVLQVHPPAPSSINPELDVRFDELCRRLLAKEPADRFQSANEAVGAMRLLQPDTSRSASEVVPPLPRRPRVPLAAVAGLLVVAAFAFAWMLWQNGAPPPPEAQRWFDAGTRLLQEGAFHSAAKAFEEGIRVYPDYPVAYARLAEARQEVDDHGAAERALIELGARLPDQTRLRREDRLRVAAIRSLVLRRMDDGVRAYAELAEALPQDAGAWLDLGRAQYAAGYVRDARISLEQALAIDPARAAGHLWLGIVAGAEGQLQTSVAALTEAERLYVSSSNSEGQAEVLIRRGALLDGLGEYKDARVVLERALAIARAISSTWHVVRAQFHLSSVTASEGNLAESQKLASEAVQAALEAQLETAAADGLTDLAATLLLNSNPTEAEKQVREAIRLAKQRGARRTLARAQMQLASVLQSRGKPTEALEALEPGLAFFREGNYRWSVLTGLTIASRAHQRLDQFGKAHQLASEVLQIAQTIKDDTQVALALGNLAAQAAALGSLPESLALRTKAEGIHRSQNDVVSLPFDLTNRAELLIRLGRIAEAEHALAEVEAGIARKDEAFVGRQQRVTFLRVLAAVVQGDYQTAADLARRIGGDGSGTDSASVLGPALLEYALAHQGASDRAVPVSKPVEGTGALMRERQYWAAATHLARRHEDRALASALEGLDELSRMQNDELAWRIAAVGSAAARALGNEEQHRLLRERALASLVRIRSAWREYARDYENRPDLTALRKAADL